MFSLKDFTIDKISKNNMFKKECYMMVEILKFIEQSDNLNVKKKRDMESAIECGIGAMVYLDNVLNGDLK